MCPRNALPGKESGIVRPMDRTLDTLTDPGGRPRDASDTRDTSDTRDARDTPGTRGTAGAPDTRGTSGTSDREKPAARDHVKLRRDLADQVRAAVWFLSEHGRPRVQLGELLDEAVEAWLAEAKTQHNDGHDFPHRGRLR